MEGTNYVNKRIRKSTCKNNAPFRSCISNISKTFADNTGDLDTVMLMYNLLEYSDNSSMTSRTGGIIIEMK